jgi:hypothetical protein
MNFIPKNSQIETQTQQYIPSERVFILLQDIKEERRISEKLEKISALLQRDDIRWSKSLFKELLNRISWISRQNLSVDLKLTFESICNRINTDKRFEKFSKERILDYVLSVQERVRTTLNTPWDRIDGVSFYKAA